MEAKSLRRYAASAEKSIRHRAWRWALVALLIGIGSNLEISSAATSPKLFENFIQRLSALQNIEVRYQLDTKQSSPPEMRGVTVTIMGERVDFKDTRYAYNGQFSFLHGDAFVELTPNDATLAEALRLNQDVPGYRYVVTPQHVDKLDHHSVGPPFLGAIFARQGPPADAFIDEGLGLRLWHAHAWMTQQDLQNAVVNADPSNPTIELTDADHLIHRWTFDRDMKTPIRYSVTQANLGRDLWVCECRKFQPVGDLLLPFEMEMTRLASRDPNQKDQTLWPIEIDDIQITDLKIDAADNTPDKYIMIWPKGSTVLDVRTGQQFNVQSGDRTLTDKEIARINAARRPRPATMRAASEPSDGG